MDLAGYTTCPAFSYVAKNKKICYNYNIHQRDRHLMRNPKGLTMNATPLTLDALATTVATSKVDFEFLLGLWRSDRLAASALINRATGWVGTTEEARNHSMSVFADHFREANGNMEVALNTRTPRTEQEFAAYIHDEPLYFGMADYKRVHSALTYVATYEMYSWLKEMQDELNQPMGIKPYYAYQMVVGLRPTRHTHCDCQAMDVFDKPDLQEQWMHQHHGDYNRMIWTLLDECAMLYRVHREWRTESAIPVDERIAGKDHGSLGDFLNSDKPEGIWFQNPSPITAAA